VKRIGYNPGCSLHSSAKDYDHTIRIIFERLRITLQELEEWVLQGQLCSTTHRTWLNLI